MKKQRRTETLTTERREGVLGDWKELYLSRSGLWVVIQRNDGAIISRTYRTEAAAREDFNRPLFDDEWRKAC